MEGGDKSELLTLKDQPKTLGDIDLNDIKSGGIKQLVGAIRSYAEGTIDLSNPEKFNDLNTLFVGIKKELLDGGLSPEDLRILQIALESSGMQQIIRDRGNAEVKFSDEDGAEKTGKLEDIIHDVEAECNKRIALRALDKLQKDIRLYGKNKLNLNLQDVRNSFGNNLLTIRKALLAGNLPIDVLDPLQDLLQCQMMGLIIRHQGHHEIPVNTEEGATEQLLDIIYGLEYACNNQIILRTLDILRKDITLYGEGSLNLNDQEVRNSFGNNLLTIRKALLARDLPIEVLIPLQNVLNDPVMQEICSSDVSLYQILVRQSEVVDESEPLRNIILDAKTECSKQIIIKAANLFAPELAQAYANSASEPTKKTKKAELLLESMRRTTLATTVGAGAAFVFLTAALSSLAFLIETGVIDLTPFGIEPENLFTYAAGPAAFFVIALLALLIAAPLIARNSPTFQEHKELTDVIILTQAYKIMKAELISAYTTQDDVVQQALNYTGQTTLSGTKYDIPIDQTSIANVISRTVSDNLYARNEKATSKGKQATFKDEHAEELKAQLIVVLMRELVMQASMSRRKIAPTDGKPDIPKIIATLEGQRPVIERLAQQIVDDTKRQFCNGSGNLTDDVKTKLSQGGKLHSLEHNTWRHLMPAFAGILAALTVALSAYAIVTELTPDLLTEIQKKLLHSSLAPMAPFIFAAIAGLLAGIFAVMVVRVVNAFQHPPIDTRIIDLGSDAQAKEKAKEVIIQTTALVSAACYNQCSDARDALVEFMMSADENMLEYLDYEAVKVLLGIKKIKNERVTSAEAEGVLIKILSMVALNKELVECICSLDASPTVRELEYVANAIRDQMIKLGIPRDDAYRHLKSPVYYILKNQLQSFQTMVKAVAQPVQHMGEFNPEIATEIQEDGKKASEIIVSPQIIQGEVPGESGSPEGKQDKKNPEPIAITLANKLEESIIQASDRMHEVNRGGGMVRGGKGSVGMGNPSKPELMIPLTQVLPSVEVDGPSGGDG